MKKIMNFVVTVFMFLFIPCVVNAATEYTVTIKPTHSGDPLEHVTVMISQNNETVTYLLTDHEGKATVRLEDGTYEAIAGYDLGNSSYAGSETFTVSGSDKEVVVEVDSDFDWDYARRIYERTTYFNHLDVKVKGTYTTGTVGNTTTHTVKLKNVKLVVENNVIANRNMNFTADFSKDTTETYEWRSYNSVSKSAKITLQADVYLDNVMVKSGYQYIIDGATTEGYNAFVQSIIDCDGNQGLDFVINPREIMQEIFYEVSYEWTGLPAGLAKLPEKSENYSEGDNHDIDEMWHSGYKIIDKTKSGVYTFSGWTHTTPADNREDITQIASNADDITVNEDTIIHGVWTFTHFEDLDEPLNYIEIRKEINGVDSKYINTNNIYFLVTDPNGVEEIISYNEFVNGIYLFPIFIDGEYNVKEVYSDIPGFDLESTTIDTTHFINVLEDETNKEVTFEIEDINDNFTCSNSNGCSGTVEFTNTYSKIIGNAINNYYDLTVLKEDAKNGNILSGAEFTLTLEGATPIKKVTNDSGFAIFEDLQEGTYTLVETKAPTGYVLDDTTHTYIVEVIKQSTATPIFDQIQNAYVLENNYIITINNLHYNASNQRLTVYNHLITTDLTVTKEVEYLEDNKKVDTPKEETNNKYNFKVTIGDEEYEFTLAAGESKTFKDILYGTTYKVEEIIATDAQFKHTKPSNSEGTIGEEDTIVKMVNTYTIKKEEVKDDIVEEDEPILDNNSNIDTNPKTGDEIMNYVIMILIASVGLVVSLKQKRIN